MICNPSRIEDTRFLKLINDFTGCSGAAANMQI